MSPILVSRILFVLLVVNEAAVVATSKSGEMKSLKIPAITSLSGLLLVAPFFFTLDYPAWLGWLIVALQAGGLVLEVLAEFQLIRARSFAISSEAATQVQRGGMYRFLENPIYIGLLIHMAAWALWMPLALIPVVLFGQIARGMVAGERAYLAEKYQATHRGIDSFLWG